LNNLEKLPAINAKGRVQVVIETQKGATAKFKFDPKLGTFKYVRPLRKGLAYPFDWGFVPSTRGEDGDPLDALVVHDSASFPGAVIGCRPVGVLEVEQTEKGKTVRNDRVIFVPSIETAPDDPDGASRKLKTLKKSLEMFFKAAVAGTGKTLVYRGWRDADGAEDAVRKAVAAAKRKSAKGKGKKKKR
jgi:inorganic pyrophosphatase